MNKQLLTFFFGFPLFVVAFIPRLHASVWDNLWQTQNQQAQQLMERHQFSEAAKRFEDDAWRATAAYRSGEYDTAASRFATLDTDEGYYNQGNALAHMGQYEKALQAYDHALRLNSKHEDAQYNRKLVEELLKKDKQQQNQDKQNQDKQNQDKQIRISKIRISKIGISKIRTSKTRTSKTRTSKTRTSKTRISKTRISKTRISKTRISKTRIKIINNNHRIYLRQKVKSNVPKSNGCA